MTARRPTPAVTIDTIRAAQKRIAAGIARTPCPHSIPLSELTGFRVWCKLDLLQRTGSFKERGARNALELLDAAKPHRIEWQWVKGHAGHPDNERADQLASDAALRS